MEDGERAVSALQKDDKYGINVRKWCSEHEGWVRGEIAAGKPAERVLGWHEKKLLWLQHERLIHLLVLLLTCFFELFLIGAAYVTGFPLTALLLVLGIMVLLGFYFRHYFFLENKVQHWYRIAEELHGLAEKDI